mgnify:CR=1 FL=1
MLYIYMNMCFNSACTNQLYKQSRNMCVKCHTDGELPVDEKSILAVHISHPAAAHRNDM